MLILSSQARPGTELVWDCVGFCTHNAPFDLAVLVAGALLLWKLTAMRLRARPPKRTGAPGRVAITGLAGIALGLAMLATGIQRVCVVSDMGVRLDCRTEIRMTVMAHGSALALLGLSTLSVSRDLLIEKSAGRVPLAPRRQPPRR